MSDTAPGWAGSTAYNLSMSAIEVERPAAQAFAVFLIEGREETLCLRQIRGMRAGGGAAERQPGTLHQVARGFPARAGARRRNSNGRARIRRCAPSGVRPGKLADNAEAMVPSPAVSLTTVRSGSVRPMNGARSTASQATRSSGDSSARTNASRSRTGATFGQRFEVDANEGDAQ